MGAEAAYDVQKAAITKYSTAIGYSAPEWSAAITASNSLSVFSASYYHKVNSQVEAGARAVWDSKSGNNVGLEVASKYRLDPTSFAKVSGTNLGLLSFSQLMYHSRRKSMTGALPRWRTMSSLDRESLLVLVSPWIPTNSMKVPVRIRLEPHLNSKDETL